MLLQAFRRFLWVCVIGFMIAWHNVYFQDDRLREEDRIEQTQLEEDEERESGAPGRLGILHDRLRENQ
ncbi:MAG: hypothetical protein RLP11_20790 [Marinoscillum sp.]|uniref:hypothetical protein n=1 Tax=Marinoscillum sp. TaxID=2024838 RepID=UPI0032F303F1